MNLAGPSRTNPSTGASPPRRVPFGPGTGALLVAAALLFAGLVLPAAAPAVIQGGEGKIAFQRMNPGTGDWDIWIRDARQPECSDGADNDSDGASDYSTDPQSPGDPQCLSTDDHDEAIPGTQPLRTQRLPASAAGANDTEPAWSHPDCALFPCLPSAGDPRNSFTDVEQVLAFASDRGAPGGPRDIYAADSDTNAQDPTPDRIPWNLTGHPADDDSPSLWGGEAEGGTIAYRMAFDSNRVSGNRDIWAMNFQGDPLSPGSQQVCRMTTDQAADSNPEWSPDGRHIAFERQTGGETQIWVADVGFSAEGWNSQSCPARNARLVTPDRPPDLPDQPASFEPTWFEWPGDATVAQRIAFSGPEDGPDSNLHFLEQSSPLAAPTTPFADGANFTQASVFYEPSEDRSPSWSPNGDGLVFASNRAGTSDLYFLDQSGDGPPAPLTAGAAEDLNPALQPLPFSAAVKGFRVCGRVCRARRRAARGTPVTAATTTTPQQPTTDDRSDPRRADGCTVAGGPGRNRLRGTGAADVICGLGGNDTLIGLGGNDVLRGGGGRDRLLGQAGRDQLYGGSGRDSMFGGSGDDLLAGGSGRDRVFGDGGADRFLARGGGRDVVSGGSGSDMALVDRRDRVRRVERRLP